MSKSSLFQECNVDEGIIFLQQLCDCASLMCWIHSVSLFDRMAVLHGMDNQSARQNQCFPSQLFSLLFQRILPPSSGSMGECALWCHRKLTPAPCHARHAPPHLMQSPFSGVTCTYNCIFRYSPLWMEITPWREFRCIAIAEQHNDHEAVDWALFLLMQWSYFCGVLC